MADGEGTRGTLPVDPGLPGNKEPSKDGAWKVLAGVLAGIAAIITAVTGAFKFSNTFGYIVSYALLLVLSIFACTRDHEGSQKAGRALLVLLGIVTFIVLWTLLGRAVNH